MKKRIISAIVMLAIIIPLIFIGGNVFKIGVGVISLFALKELVDLKVSHHKIPIPVYIISMVLLLLLIYSDFEGLSIMYGITYRGLALLILALLSLTLFYNDYNINDAMFMIASTLLLGVSFNAMILLRSLDIKLFFNIILVSILTDTFALFGGKLLGRHKLIKHVSPNKTVEGAICGTFFSVLICSLFYQFLIKPLNIKVVIAFLCLSIIGQLGDLIFSKIKRENNLKDFSNIIPGHGGILDRLDSPIAVMLGFLIFYGLFNII